MMPRGMHVHIAGESGPCPARDCVWAAPTTESTSARLRRVEQELAEMREARDVLREQRDQALAEVHVLKNSEAVELVAAEAQLLVVQAELNSARAELDQRRPGGWCVARDGGRTCTACGQEIGRGQAYAVNTVRGQLTHLFCPEVTP